jgi:hypothetical protein
MKREMGLYDTLEVVDASPRAFVGAVGDVLLSIWREDITLADIALTEPAQELAWQKTGTFASLAYVEPKAMRMPDDARKEAARITTRAGDRLVASGVVIPLGGFTGSIARTVTNGIHFLSRSKAPQKVFATTEETCGWVLERLGHDPSHLAKFVARVEEARARTSR